MSGAGEDAGGFSEVVASVAPAAAGIGHNKGEDWLRPAEQIAAHIESKHHQLFERADEIMRAEERLPPIENDDAESKATEFVKLIQVSVKNLDLARVGECAPYDAARSAVHAHFKRQIDQLDDPNRGKPGLKQRVLLRLGDYKREKEARERARLQAEADARRAAEEEARRVAAAAEAAAREAEQAAARKRNEAAIAEANAKAVALREQADQAAAAARETVAPAADAAKAAAVKPAELTRSRGGRGGISSLQTFWDFENLERDRLDLEPLRAHIPIAALESAVRSYIKAGGRKLPGVRIFENDRARVS